MSLGGVLHKGCNMRTRDLPDISALALGRRAYISGKSLVPMLQLYNVTLSHLRSKGNAIA